MGNGIMSKKTPNQKTNNSIKDIGKNICTGCKLCQDICPENAISFKYDEEGFWYPSVNTNLCINCGICKKYCPTLFPEKRLNKANHVPITLGVWNKNEMIRWESTSGGFFSTLAEYLIKKGYYVAGAVYDKEFKVTHIISQNLVDIQKMRQSKYSQSDTKYIYKKILNLLKNGEKVFFCGTPCQVEALHQIVNDCTKNLITMDFVCAGISSPIVFQRYIQWLENKYHSSVTKVWFKNKKEGWDQIGTQISFKNGKTYFRIGSRDPFMISFVKDYANIRKSCFNCKYRKIPHNSDFTVGDFWGIEKFHPELNDNLGITALIINTSDGINVFNSIEKFFHIIDTTPEEIIKYNPTVINSLQEGEKRHEFLVNTLTRGLNYAINRYSSYKGIKKIKLDLMYLKKKTKIILSKIF